MRVAFVLDAFPIVSELFIVEEISGLLDLGVEVEIFASRRPPEAATHDKLERYGLVGRTRYRVPRKRSATWLAIGRAIEQAPPARRRQLVRLAAHSVWTLHSISPAPMLHGLELLEGPPFDIVHVHFGHIARLVAPVRAAGYPAPLVTTFHGYDANVEPRLRGDNVYRSLFEVGDLFTVNSRFLQRRLVRLGCDPERIAIVPMGVDLDDLRFSPRTLEEGEPLRLLTVARLVEAKGIETAIRAVVRLVEEGRDVEYRVVGDGELRPSLQQLVAGSGMSSRVHLLGALPHQAVRRLYEDSHVFVLPSIRSARGDEESQGVVVQEAQAVGMPVVVSDIGGIREGIVEGRSGVVFPAGNAEALARAISGLVSAASEWGEMGRTGRELVRARYTRRQHCQRLLELYESTARRSRTCA